MQRWCSEVVVRAGEHLVHDLLSIDVDHGCGLLMNGRTCIRQSGRDLLRLNTQGKGAQRACDDKELYSEELHVE